MSNRYVVVLDAGSSSLRSLVFDNGNQVVSSASTPWSYLDVSDVSPWAREFDPKAAWGDICRVVNQSLQDAHFGSGRVAAIAVTGQRQAVAFLDVDGRELYLGPNLDLRAVFEGGQIDQQAGDQIYRTTGHMPSFLLAPAKLRWFREHRPQIYERIASVITLADWIALRLTGELASEPTLAAGAGLLNVERRNWSKDLQRDLDLVENNHVRLLGAGAIMGRVRECTSRDTAFPLRTPVVVAGADTQCGLLGMGVSRPTETGVVAGWSAPVQVVVDDPIMPIPARTWTGCFLTADKWVIESTAGDVGNAYRWLAQLVCGSTGREFYEMDHLAKEAPAGSEGVFLVLGPPKMDMSKLGMSTGGALFPVPLTFDEPSRGQLARAGLEAVAYGVRANLERAEGVVGNVSKQIAVGGGMTKTAAWVELVADVLGRPVQVMTSNVSATGAYVCAATALGEFSSLEEGGSEMSRGARILEPDTRDTAEYAGYYEAWLELAEGLQGQAIDG